MRKVTSVPGAAYMGETMHNGIETVKFNLSSGGYSFDVSADGAIAVKLLDGYSAF
jgi:hypothetical protein